MLIATSRRDKSNWHCAEEYAMMAILGGLFLPGVGYQNSAPCLLDRREKCTTREALLQSSHCTTAAFFYKHEMEADSCGQRILRDKGTRMLWRGDGHPAEVLTMSAESMAALRQSRFLFMRKFHESANIAGYPHVVFGQS